MPKFAILITKDEYGWWHYMLVVEHKAIPNGENYPSAQTAFQAALFAANRRGYYNEG